MAEQQLSLGIGSGGLREAIGDRTVVASVSGGKDSAALSLFLSEQGIQHRRVFMDTGWEHPLTYEYLRGPLTDKLGPIEEIRAVVPADRPGIADAMYGALVESGFGKV